MLKRLAKSFCAVTGIPSYWIKTVAYEGWMFFVRLYGIMPFQALKLKKTFANAQSVNLIFGCGNTSHLRWLGVDCFFARNVDFVLDLRRKFPFRSGSVDLCHSEHFLEHLRPEEARVHLAEVFRVLKPGGRYRIVVPAAFRFIERYEAKDRDFFELAFPWVERPMDAIRDIVYFSGDHKNIFDFAELEYLGKRAGFMCVKECAANISEIKDLCIDNGDPQRVAESLYVEMVKGI